MGLVSFGRPLVNDIANCATTLSAVAARRTPIQFSIMPVSPGCRAQGFGTVACPCGCI